MGVLRTRPGTDNFNQWIPDATVELRMGDTILSTQTDTGGFYRFDGVPTGTYHFAVKNVPAEFRVTADKAGGPVPSITIAEQSCYAQNIYTSQMVSSAQ